MGLEAVVLSATSLSKDKAELPKTVSDAVLETLNDTAVRREVYELVSNVNDDLSMMEVHQILDALISVCSD